MHSLVLDNHVCLPFNTVNDAFDRLRVHREAGFTAVSVNIGYGDMLWDEHVDFANRLREWINRNPAKYYQISSVEDLTPNTCDQRLGIFLDVEGGSLLERDPARLATLHKLGVRWMCLTYNKMNELVGGCLPGTEDHGLTKLGKQVVDEMNRLGIVVCCSHTGARSARDIIEYSKLPPIFSHSNSKSVYPHWRHIDDGLIVACADKGGVICVNGVGPFLSNNTASTDALFAHLDHMLDLVGPRHVGVGLDFVYDTEELERDIKRHPSLFSDVLMGSNGFSFVPPTALSEIQRHLLKRGLDTDEVSLVLGDNIARVALQAWR